MDRQSLGDRFCSVPVAQLVRVKRTKRQCGFRIPTDLYSAEAGIVRPLQKSETILSFFIAAELVSKRAEVKVTPAGFMAVYV